MGGSGERFLKGQALCYYSEMAVQLVSGAHPDEALDVTSRAIMGDGIVAVPTETFYGLCARYDCESALERLYAIKGRTKNRALPLIIGDEAMTGLVANEVTGVAKILAGRFWPGPLTLLLDARKDLPELITAGTGRVAVRVPGPSFALDLVRSVGVPLTATSANISGQPPAECASEVIDYFGDKLDVVVDAGRTPGGMPSTIVEVTGGQVRIARPGKISEKEILDALESITKL